MTVERAMSREITNPFPRLKTATTTDVDYREYKSGAKYKGQVNNHRKTGRGSFIWPNGSRYEGQFMDNVRHGQGLQQWADGSTFDGDFVQDVRHGIGKHTWANGEVYEGKFYRDRRHGRGRYAWPDGSFFQGTFYLDQKEGYGMFTFADGTRFEGLYVSNERHGPGIVFHSDGTQDVGLWNRERLVKLCTEIPKAFTMKDHPEVEYYPEEHQIYISSNTFTENRMDIIQSIVQPPEVFDYEPKIDLSGRMNEIFSDGLHSCSLAMDNETFDLEFYKDANCNGSTAAQAPSEQIVATNNTPSAIALQCHVIRHSHGQGHATFNVDQLLKGDRGGCANGSKGLAENDSEEFLKAAIAGDFLRVQTALNKGLVHVDVADKNGNTALMGAAVNWHEDIINLLLDNGADINRQNDEGLCALNACHIKYYSPEYFKYNIAEKDLERPADMEQEPGYDVNEAVKGLAAASAKKSRGASRASMHLSTIDNRKINKLRREYSQATTAVILEEGHLAPASLREDEPFDDRELGTLKVKRAEHVNVDDMLNMNDADIDAMSNSWKEENSFTLEEQEDEDEDEESTADEFESSRSVRNYSIEVTDQLIDRSATALSTNEMLVGRDRAEKSKLENLGTVRRLAMDKSQRAMMKATIDLLLKRGADPNACGISMPVLFCAIKAADVDAVRLLLSKGASTSARLSHKKGGLAALHIASCIPGEEGVQITELLLNSLANPDSRATEDDSFLNRNFEEEWSKDVIPEASAKLLGGRSPLQLACARDDNYRNACRVVHLLLDHHANPNLLCNGHSALALAVSSGNDLAVEKLLEFGADPCLPLTHGVGNALCIASSTEFEQRRTPKNRLLLIEKLIKAGADILAPVAIGPKRVMGTAVDFAYHMFNADRRIAHMPYHALTYAERETFNARRMLVTHMGDILRTKAVEREKIRLQEEEELAALGLRGSRGLANASANFVYTGAGSVVPPPAAVGIIKRNSRMTATLPPGDSTHVSFSPSQQIDNVEGQGSGTRKQPFRYCYECGRSVGVRLSACTRCKQVFYCSKACKLKAWNARHKEECVRIGGRSAGSGKGRDSKRVDSPTPTTDPEKNQPTTVTALISKEAMKQLKLPPLHDTAPNIFMGGHNARTRQGKTKGQRVQLPTRSSFAQTSKRRLHVATSTKKNFRSNCSKSFADFGRSNFTAPSKMHGVSVQMQCLSANYGKTRDPPRTLSPYEENYSNN